MEASIVDLRYRMKGILAALDRKERVTIMYHGKKKGVIIPTSSDKKMSVTEHPFFGMTAGKDGESVAEIMDELRDTRHK